MWTIAVEMWYCITAATLLSLISVKRSTNICMALPTEVRNCENYVQKG